MHEYEKAQNYYNQAIAKDSKNIEFLMHRAQSFFDQSKRLQVKNFQPAIEDLQNGLDHSNNNPLLLYKLGLAYYADEQYKRAIK